MSKDLIAINTNTIGSSTIDSVGAKELYVGLGLSESQWSRWSTSNIEKNTFFSKDKDWIAFDIMSNGNETSDYYISIEFAKHLAMTAKTSKAHDYRNYFIECERKAKMPITYIEALRLHLESEIAKQKALDEVAKLNSIIDNEFGYSSILRAATYAGVHESTFNWRTLKPIAIGLGLPPKQVPSPRFGYMNIYPIKAFQEAYPSIDFDDLTPELVDDKALLAITHA